VDTLTIAGAPVASGAPSAEITLSLGDNPVAAAADKGLRSLSSAGPRDRRDAAGRFGYRHAHGLHPS
jgi:hypothetical protein